MPCIEDRVQNNPSIGDFAAIIYVNRQNAMNYDAKLFVDREKKYRGFQKLLQPDTRQALMLIEAPKDFGKTWLMGKLVEHCQQTDPPTPVALLDFRSPRERHDIQDALGMMRLLRDKLNRPPYFDAFNQTINGFATAVSDPNANSGILTFIASIEKHFNLNELPDLTLAINVVYDNIAGDTLRIKARELVQYCQRMGLLASLLAACRQLRPKVVWGEGLETAVSQPTSTTLFTDNNTILRFDSDVERQRAERQISNAFFDALSTLMKNEGQVVLLFDSYEAAPAEVERWLLESLFPLVNNGPLADLVIIVTGRQIPDLSDLNIPRLTVKTGLDPFEEKYVREYFEDRRNIQGLNIPTITITSGGIPGTLAIMADRAMATSMAEDDFFDDL